jgi:hypothetical protein
MNLTIVIAQAGEGKTFFCKRNFIYKKPKCLPFDINNEYYEDKRLTDAEIKAMVTKDLTYKMIFDIVNPKLPVDNKLNRSRFVGKVDDTEGHEKYMMDFLNVAIKKRNTNIVIDESTIFFQGRVTSDKIRALIGLRRHTRNNIVLNFLSIEDVPPYLLRNSNFIVLFKTADSEKSLSGKSQFLLEYFKKLQKMPDHSYIIIPRNIKIAKPEIVTAKKK